MNYPEINPSGFFMQDNIKQENNLEKLDFESKQNLVGFFDLLLKIDMRINPDLYKEDYQPKEK
ncbi:MAG: hypothetical protein WD607_01240 [Candidatus Paceibacterota bacterium]